MQTIIENSVFSDSLELQSIEEELLLLSRCPPYLTPDSGFRYKTLKKRQSDIASKRNPKTSVEKSATDKKEKDRQADLHDQIKEVEVELRNFYPNCLRDIKTSNPVPFVRADGTQDVFKRDDAALVSIEEASPEPEDYFYGFPYEDTYVRLSSPRARFLLRKRRYLKEHLKKLEEEKAKKPEKKSENQPTEESTLSKIKAVFFWFLEKLHPVIDVGKKIIDLADDIWAAASKAVPPKLAALIGPILVGMSNFFIHAYETIVAAYDLYKALNKKNIPALRVFTNSVSIALTSTGIGLSISLLLSKIGLYVAGAVFMPVILPSLLLGVYSLGLVRKSFTLHRAKEKEEAAALKEYNQYRLDNNEELESLEEKYKIICEEKNDLQDQLNKAIKKTNDLKKQISHKNALRKTKRKELNNLLPDEDPLTHKTREEELRQEIAQLNTEINTHKKRLNEIDINYLHEQLLKKSHEQLETNYARQEIINNIEIRKQNYEKAREKRLEAEREVSLGVIEIIGTCLVLAGTILGAAAIVGAASAAIFSAASIPLILICVGVGIGVGVKVFEKVDAKYNHKFSNGMRNFFVNTWKGFTGLFSSCLPTNAANPDPLLAPIENNDQPPSNNDDESPGRCTRFINWIMGNKPPYPAATIAKGPDDNNPIPLEEIRLRRSRRAREVTFEEQSGIPLHASYNFPLKGKETNSLFPSNPMKKTPTHKPLSFVM